MNKFGWSRVLLGVAVVLLPGAMLLLPLVLVLLSRRRAAAEGAPEDMSPVPAPVELNELAPASARSIRLANA